MEPVSAALITETRAKGWNNSIVSFDVSYAIGFDPVTPLTSRISSKGTRYNLTTINIPTDYDTLLAEATVEPDTEKRKAMCQEMMRLIIDKHCMANPLYVGNSLI
jgi:hypothetical protein